MLTSLPFHNYNLYLKTFSHDAFQIVVVMTLLNWFVESQGLR